MQGGLTIVIPTCDREFDLPAAVAAALAVRHTVVDSRVLVVDSGSRDGTGMLLRQLEALYAADGFGATNAPLTDAIAQTLTRYILLTPVDHTLVAANVWLLVRTAVETRAAVVYGNVIHADGSVSGNESVQPGLFRTDYLPAVLLFDREQFDDVGIGINVLATLCHGRRAVFVPVVTAFAPRRQTLPKPESPEPDLRERWPLASRHQRYYPEIGSL